MGKHDPDDPVTMYIREASNVEPLTKDEETNLFRLLARVGDWGEERENVARRLVESQLALVVSIAQKYSASGVPMLDLIERGEYRSDGRCQELRRKADWKLYCPCRRLHRGGNCKGFRQNRNSAVWRYIATTPATCKMMHVGLIDSRGDSPLSAWGSAGVMV